MNQKELPGYVAQELPELSAICKKENSNTAHSIMKQMIRYTYDNLFRNNIANVGKCLKVAGNLYKEGDAAIRNAVENVFVFSFSKLFFHKGWRENEIKKLIPLPLYEVYRKQMLDSHL